MGLFDFIGDVASATVKVTLTPIAITKDVVNISTGGDADSTKKLIESAGDDFKSAGDRMMGEK